MEQRIVLIKNIFRAYLCLNLSRSLSVIFPGLSHRQMYRKFKNLKWF